MVYNHNYVKSIFYQKVIYPVYAIKFGPSHGLHIISHLKLLNATQWLSDDELINYQNIKLRKLINHVYQNVPYYHNLMSHNDIRPEDIKSIKDLRYFPILTKDIIRDNYLSIMSKDSSTRKTQKASTGGTTGEPISFFRDNETLQWVEAAFLRGLSWAGYRLGDTIIHFTHDSCPSSLGRLRLKLLNAYSFPGFDKEDKIIEYFQIIHDNQPVYIKGSASYLYRIASIWKKNNLDNLKVLGFFSTSEMLYDYQRAFLESTFKCKVYDFYGCNEVPSLAYECEYGNKHITSERAVIETVNSKDINVSEIPGRILLTDLDNYVMPFIRYNIGDFGTITHNKCQCNRGLPVLKNVEGRIQDMLRTVDGDYIPAIFFPNRFHKIEGIKQYQIIQNDIASITLKIIKNKNFNQRELDEMIQLIKDVIGCSISVTVQECIEIPLTNSGKARLVISKA